MKELRSPGDAEGAQQSFVESEDTLFDTEFIAQLSGLSLLSRKKQTGGQRGDARSRKKGEGLEFADYQTGVWWMGFLANVVIITAFVRLARHPMWKKDKSQK